MDFSSFSQRSDPGLDLLTGALLIARDAYPGLDLPAEVARIDALSRPLMQRELWRLPAAAQARAIGDHLYVVSGFRGNAENYHDPDNSFVNVVLDRKLGIPISLAVVYLEVARRAGVQARGVGFPGHFLVRVDDKHGTAIVDPFFGGELLDRDALQGLLRRTSARIELSEGMLDPMPSRHILVRMLMNLRSIYAARADAGRLLLVLDRLVDLVPDAADEVRDRGYLCARLGAREAALADLRHYIEALPHAGDAPEVRRAIQKLEAEGLLVQ